MARVALNHTGYDRLGHSEQSLHVGVKHSVYVLLCKTKKKIRENDERERKANLCGEVCLVFAQSKS